MTNNIIISTENISGVLTKLEDAFYDIPFDNSNFQNKAFVLAAEITPARAYRSLGLKMFSKIQAVQENMFAKELTLIDIEEMLHKINSKDIDIFEKRRLEIKLQQIKSTKKWADKLLNDAINELNFLYSEFVKYPKYTREEFEQEEQLHFEQSLSKQIKLESGAALSIANIIYDMPELEKTLETINQTFLKNK